MARSWNGEFLVDHISATLGDTSSTFKTKVLYWLNKVQRNISSEHDWPFHLTKGKKIILGGEEIHPLEVEAPTAPTIAVSSGSGLTSGSTYSVLLTFIQDNGAETVSGDESDTVTASGGNLRLSLTDLPTSDESLVTKRNVYMSKDGGDYYYHSQIDDNFSTTLTISSETSSTIEAPDYGSIRRLSGSPFFEGSPSVYLKYKDIDQLRLLVQGQWAQGSPEYFAPIESNSISTYPLPSTDLELSFNYYRQPFRIYYTSTSQPDLPIHLEDALIAGVIAEGYAYRDRAGQEIKKANYENALVDAINRGGRAANIEYTVRDVYGNFNGIEVG
jgi:hypothetical protein